MKFEADNASHPATMTLILSVGAFAGTFAIIFVSLTTVKAVADAIPNLTEVAPVKPLPVIVTHVPAGPVTGENEAMLAVGIQGAAVVTEISFELPVVPQANTALTT